MVGPRRSWRAAAAQASMSQGKCSREKRWQMQRTAVLEKKEAQLDARRALRSGGWRRRKRRCHLRPWQGTAQEKVDQQAGMKGQKAAGGGSEGGPEVCTEPARQVHDEELAERGERAAAGVGGCRIGAQ